LNEPWRSLFAAAAGAWLGALVLALLAERVLLRRHGRALAWPPCRTLLALADLVGTWAATLCATALLLGRRGFGWPWATALFLVALAATASLYDRAVLLPSLDASFKRTQADAAAKWEEERRFLFSMARWARWGTLGGGAGALACGLLA
jgi:hypothetical protein